MNIRKEARRCFKELVNILDNKSDYYILNYYINEQNKANKEKDVNHDNNDNNKKDENKENNNPFPNVNSIFVALILKFIFIKSLINNTYIIPNF